MFPCGFTHTEIEIIDGITEEREAETEEKHVHQALTDSWRGRRHV